MADNQKIALGVIGYRGFGAFCTEAFHQSGFGQVVAFAGRDAAAMAETARRCDVPKTYTDWRALVADPEVQLVHIVTPPSLHAPMAVAALRAGKDVLIEKPLATTEADAQAILDAERASGWRIAGVNYVMRYNALYETVSRITHDGLLGALTHVGFENYASDEGLGHGHWFWDRAQSGGIFVEHGVHFFDIIGHIIAAPAQSVTAQTWARGDGTGKEDRVQAIVTYANGVEASYYHAFNRPGALEEQTAHFAFERGHITLHGWIPTDLSLSGLVSADDLTALRALLDVTTIDDKDFPATGRAVRGGGRTYRIDHRIHAEAHLGAPTPVYRQAVQDALADLAAALSDPAHLRRVTSADGFASLRVALAAQQAAATGSAQQLF